MSPSPRRHLLLVCCLVGLACLVALGATVPALGGSLPAVGADDAEFETSEPEPVPDLELPERLELDGPVTDGTTVVRTDAATAVQRDGARLDGAYDRYLVEEQLNRARSDVDRRENLSAAVERVDRTVQGLREREAQARSGYQSGRLTEQEFLYELRAISLRAEEADETLDALRAHDETIASSGVGRTIDSLTAQVQARQGSVRSQLTAATDGGAPLRVYVASGNDGVVLATISGDEYYREANRDDELVVSGEPGMDLGRASDVRDEWYPDVVELYGFSGISHRAHERQLFWTDALLERNGITHGDLVSYIDAHSEGVVREDQRLRLTSDLPRREAVTATEESATLELERTYPSGPALVTVTDDGDPVQGVEVTVNGAATGETNPAGEYWIVLPYDEPTVEATVDGTPVELDLGGNTSSPDGPTGA